MGCFMEDPPLESEPSDRLPWEARDIRLFRRVQAVLRGAEGCSVSEAARQAGLDRTSLHRWINLYLRNHQVESLSSGRPREADDLDDELVAAVLALDPREQGYRATTW